MSQEKRLFELRELFLKPYKPGDWRVRRDQQIGFTRWRIVESIYQAGRPLNVYQISFTLQRSVSSTRSHLRVLESNCVLCTRLTPGEGEDVKTYYAVCPICPLAHSCREKLPFWMSKGNEKESFGNEGHGEDE